MQQTKRRLSATDTGDAANCKKVAGSPKNALSALSDLSVIVADTADFGAIAEFSPTDATTNPSLVLQAAQQEKYNSVLQEAIVEAKKSLGSSASKQELLIEECVDHIIVAFGCEILKIVPGVVSTEVNACLSFDVNGSVEKARKLIKLYEAKGISKDRILIKMAATWEGIQAAKILESEGIHCNITLLFSLVQAAAAAEAGATLISPFVGRILDWFKKVHPEKADSYVGAEDPGVKSVREIYNYYKTFGYPTIVMGASFRNIGEIIALAGCDKLTVSPKLLSELSAAQVAVPVQLSVESAKSQYKENPITKLCTQEHSFRWQLNQNVMASEKLNEGIRTFNSDLEKLKELVSKHLQENMANGK